MDWDAFPLGTGLAGSLGTFCWHGNLRKIDADLHCALHLPQVAEHMWRQVAVLEHHSSPVLATAMLPLPLPTLAEARIPPGAGLPPPVRILAFSGATDGSIAIWDLSGAIEAGSWSGARLRLAPMHVLHGLHQSGINALSVATPGASRHQLF